MFVRIWNTPYSTFIQDIEDLESVQRLLYELFDLMGVQWPISPAKAVFAIDVKFAIGREQGWDGPHIQISDKF